MLKLCVCACYLYDNILRDVNETEHGYDIKCDTTEIVICSSIKCDNNRLKKWNYRYIDIDIIVTFFDKTFAASQTAGPTDKENTAQEKEGVCEKEKSSAKTITFGIVQML